MREIAKVVGVSHVTVSLAIRNHASIPVTTRQRIQKVARELGYRPDPALSSLNSYRLSKHTTRYQSTVAWIDAFPMHGRGVHEDPDNEHHFCWLGAQKRATELGYQLDVFRVYEPGMTGARLSRILRSRQIQGVILSPLAPGISEPDLEWDWFSVMALGLSHIKRFHVVCSSQYRNARLAMQQLHEKGYKRIGFLTWKDMGQRTEMNFASGAWAEEEVRERPFCMLNLQDVSAISTQEKVVATWLKKHKPDAILTHDSRLIVPLLKRLGYRVPQDMAVAMLSHVPLLPEIAGVDQNAYEIGVAAVNQLAGLIQHNERGLPATPLHVLVDGHWVDGPSVPSVKKK